MMHWETKTLTDSTYPVEFSFPSYIHFIFLQLLYCISGFTVYIYFFVQNEQKRQLI